jgi:hypothetical protein
MRFFFHLRDVDTYEEDHEGIEFPSLAEGIAEARRSAREMVAELVLNDDVVDGQASKSREATDLPLRLLRSRPHSRSSTNPTLSM